MVVCAPSAGRGPPGVRATVPVPFRDAAEGGRDGKLHTSRAQPNQGGLPRAPAYFREDVLKHLQWGLRCGGGGRGQISGVASCPVGAGAQAQRVHQSRLGSLTGVGGSPMWGGAGLCAPAGKTEPGTQQRRRDKGSAWAAALE